MTTEHFIIDGFNFAHSYGRSGKRGQSGDIKRMVYDLEDHSYRKDREMTVVFDGIRFKGEFVSSKAIRIFFSQPPESADELIGRLMNETPPRDRLRYVLVSDDNALRNMALGLGMRVKQTKELSQEMEKSAAQEQKTRTSKIPEPFNNPFFHKL